MAVDPRLIMSGQFAEHLWLTSASDGKTGYFINKKGQGGGPDNTYIGGEQKMGNSENRVIQNILSSVSTTDILNFKKEKKRKYSQWDITKVGDFGDGLQGIATSPSWGWDIYFKDDASKKKLSKFEFQLLHHEIGHSIGLSHPGENPTNPMYSMADTVMSYNVVYDNNGNVVPYGYTSSDANAIMSWWNTSGFVKQEDTKPEDLGSFNVYSPEIDDDLHDHNHMKLEIETKSFPVIKLNAQEADGDFSKIWKSNTILLAQKIRSRRGYTTPLVAKLGKDDDVVDFTNWSGDGLPSDVSVGHLVVKGQKGDDTFVLRGNKAFEDDLFGKDLVISGGKGNDMAIIDDAFDFPNSKAGHLAGNKVIRFYGDTQPVETDDGRKVVYSDSKQGVIIRSDVEQIKIGGSAYEFNELYNIIVE